MQVSLYLKFIISPFPLLKSQLSTLSILTNFWKNTMKKTCKCNLKLINKHLGSIWPSNLKLVKWAIIAYLIFGTPNIIVIELSRVILFEILTVFIISYISFFSLFVMLFDAYYWLLYSTKMVYTSSIDSYNSLIIITHLVSQTPLNDSIYLCFNNKLTFSLQFCEV